MPFGFADSGVRCGQCGHFLNVLSHAIPELPDPIPVTCPYCGYSASYPKSAICSDIALFADKTNAARWTAALLAAIGIIMVVGLLTTRAHSAEAEDASAPASAQDCAVIAALGKVKLGWGAQAPEYLLSRNSFGQDCNWARLGIVGPSVAPASDSPFFQGLRASFSRVSYGSDGVATIGYGLGGNASVSSYFAVDYTCRVGRKNGRWQLIACTMRSIT